MHQRPRQSAFGLWNISFGFFGIQIGFALQNANMSRIFQTLSPQDPDILNKLPALWAAAPLTGLLVQPVIGHMSDRTWLGRLGRRRPYFIAGALLATLALLAMPLAPALLFAAILLWMLDASLNVSMEPFRAFVGDMLPGDQHAAGYAVQTAFIGAGAVVGSIFPRLLEALGVANTAPPGVIPPTVRDSFWFGGAALLIAVGWTVLTTREYPPAENFARNGALEEKHALARLAALPRATALAWIAAGLIVIALVQPLALRQEIYLLGALLVGYGSASLIVVSRARAGRGSAMLGAIVGDFSGMPPLMKRLALVQFFSWSALFIMWINTTPVVAGHWFGATDPTSAAFQRAANWVDVLFATYNGVAALAALLLLPRLARALGKARAHGFALLGGAAGYASFFLIRDPQWLLLSEVGIGVAWASILAMPYAILASSLPSEKLGIYMGLFNVFVVVPQLLVATVMGSIAERFFPGQPLYTMGFASAVMLLAALASLRVRA